MNVHHVNLENLASGRPQSTDLDPALAISAEIRELEARFNKLDATFPRPDGAEGIYLEAEMEHLSDRIFLLREGLSTVRATSPAGAAAQLAQIFIICETANMVEHDDDQAEKDYRQIKRMIFSIAEVLEAQIPIEARGAILELGEHCDPWRTYRECLASLDSEAA